MRRPEFTRIESLTALPELSLLLRHGKLGALTSVVGIVLGIVVVVVHEANIGALPEYVWGAILSIPATVLCMGMFSVFYEYYMRTTFARSMRSLYWAWDTGVTVFPTHRDAPDRKVILGGARTRVRLMSTTFSRYFTDVRGMVDECAHSGVQFQFVVYDPSSKAVDEKALEEGCQPDDFRDEIRSTCRRYLGPLVQKYPSLIQVRFCDFNTPFGTTIVDDREMVLSLNIYGLARAKNETPCLIIENKYDDGSVFKLYESSFDAIWKKLEGRAYPADVAKFFESPLSNTNTQPDSALRRT